MRIDTLALRMLRRSSRSTRQLVKDIRISMALTPLDYRVSEQNDTPGPVQIGWSTVITSLPGVFTHTSPIFRIIPEMMRVCSVNMITILKSRCGSQSQGA